MFNDNWNDPIVTPVKALNGNAGSRAALGDPWANPRGRESQSALAEAWPTMTIREKLIGIIGSIVIGGGTAIIIAALLGG